MNKADLLARAPKQMDMVLAGKWRERLRATSDTSVKALINGAEEWARMMEVCIQDGMTVAEAADATYKLSWLYGTSGYAATQATLLLVHHWVHGNELQSWHNRRHGISARDDYKGLFNPPIIEM